MTDPTPDPTTPAPEHEQNYFAWWIIMILFLIPIGGMLVVWWHSKNTNWLLYAGGTLFVGLIVASMATAGDTKNEVSSDQSK